MHDSTNDRSLASWTTRISIYLKQIRGNWEEIYSFQSNNKSLGKYSKYLVGKFTYANHSLAQQVLHITNYRPVYIYINRVTKEESTLRMIDLALDRVNVRASSIYHNGAINNNSRTVTRARRRRSNHDHRVLFTRPIKNKRLPAYYIHGGSWSVG